MRIAKRGLPAIGLALALLAGPGAEAAPERDNFAFLQASTVRVIFYPQNGPSQQGTGFVIATADARNADNAVIVTALHVVNGRGRIEIYEANRSEPLEANLRARDPDRDVAFLEVRGLRNGGSPLELTAVVPPVGRELRATGYSIGADSGSRRQAAAISSVQLGAYSRSIPNPPPIWRLADVGVAQFQHSIPTAKGFSGGPVTDKCGRVIGFNISNNEIELGGLPLNLEPGTSFAVAGAELIKAAQDNGIRFTQDTTPCAAAATSPPPPPSVPQPDQPNQPSFIQTKVGVAIIVGAFALLALGLACWLLFWRPSRSGRSRATMSPPPAPPATPSVSPPPPVPPSPSDFGSTGRPTGKHGQTADLSRSPRTVTLRGTGPGGEAIRLRFTADELRGQPRTIGTESEVRVPDNRAKAFISRSHAEISWDGENFNVKDLKSMNGTQLDGQELKPFEERRLRDGATLKLADVALSVQID